MQDVNDSVSSGTDKATSGAEAATKHVDSTSGESEGLAKTLDKAIREKKNAMDKIREMEAQVKKLSEEKLVQNQQFKELADVRLSELEAIKLDRDNIQKVYADEQINGKLRSELFKYGLNTSLVDYALRIIDKSYVQVDPETRRVIGAEEAARDFHSKFAGQSFFGSAKPGTSQAAPGLDNNISSDESYRVELSKAKTQKDLDAVLKKFGK